VDVLVGLDHRVENFVGVVGDCHIFNAKVFDVATVVEVGSHRLNQFLEAFIPELIIVQSQPLDRFIIGNPTAKLSHVLVNQLVRRQVDIL
jgi:hypothetical protein